MEISRHWRLKQQRYLLMGEVCSNCNAKNFPPRDVCPNCGDEAKKEFETDIFQLRARQPVMVTGNG